MKRLTLVLAAAVLCAGAQELPIAIVTQAPVPGGWEANAPLLEQSVRAAAKDGAKFVVLPELAWTGSLKAYPDAAHVPAESIPGPATKKWGAVAKEIGVWIVVPVIERSAHDGTATIAAVLLDHQGEIAAVRHKVLARQGAEDGPVARGNFREMQDSVDIGGARIGILLGDDLRVGVPRLALRGADVVLVAAGWTKSDPTPWAEVSEQLARENLVSLVVASREPSAAFNGLFAPGHHPASAEKPWTVFRVPLRQKAWKVSSSLGLPSTVPAPSNGLGSEEIAALGKRLFFDQNMSSTGKVACASCHQPEHGFTNGKPKGEGVYARTTKRNVPSLLNVAFRPLLQWDGYASTLENFAKYPISGVSEMNFHYLDKVGAYLESQPSYVRDFQSALGVTKIQFDDVSYALAAYQRTLISGDSPFDRYYYGHRADAMSPEAIRGLALFQGKANCASCHIIGRDYALFMDFGYHATGVGYKHATREFGDIGLGSISTDDQAGLFQTPPLRNVAETAPYMHDGSLPTLEAVIELYNQGGVPNPKLDPRIRPLHLSSQEKSDLAAFLRSLTGAQRYEGPKQQSFVTVRSTGGER